jgi:hypothetical protein
VTEAELAEIRARDAQYKDPPESPFLSQSIPDRRALLRYVDELNQSLIERGKQVYELRAQLRELRGQ